MKVLVCDDDYDIVEEVSKYLKEFEIPMNASFDIFKYTDSTSISINDRDYDIAIIDIEMPETNGILLSEMLKKNNPDILIIILTAYLKYLDDAMKIEVFRYLQKPIDKQRLNRSISDAVEKIKNVHNRLLITLRDRQLCIDINDILYIENEKNGSIIVTENQRIKNNKKPSEWLAQITAYQNFVFCHKSFCINLSKVISLSKREVILKQSDKTFTIPVSQSRYHELKNKFAEYAERLM